MTKLLSRYTNPTATREIRADLTRSAPTATRDPFDQIDDHGLCHACMMMQWLDAFNHCATCARRLAVHTTVAGVALPRGASISYGVVTSVTLPDKPGAVLVRLSGEVFWCPSYRDAKTDAALEQIATELRAAFAPAPRGAEGGAS